MNYSLLSKSYNECIRALKDAENAGDRERAVELARKAAEIAAQIAFAPNVMPEVAQRYREEITVLARYAQNRPRPSAAEERQAVEDPRPAVKPKTDDAPEESFEELERQLNSLIGLKDVKSHIMSTVNLINTDKFRREEGLAADEVTRHMVFEGAPGTGKTTVAKIVAKMLRALGVLSKGHLIEAKSDDLIAGYEGQTAIKTRKVIESALGGVLFIDEAYSMVVRENGENPFGKEAIAVLLTYMDEYRDDFVVIVAGYHDEMEKFVQSNSGLPSRFKNTINFEDYSEEELMQIFELKIKGKYGLSPAARARLEEFIGQIYQNRTKYFANGRTVRNLLEDVRCNQSNRLVRQYGGKKPPREALYMFEADDIPDDYTKYIK